MGSTQFLDPWPPLVVPSLHLGRYNLRALGFLNRVLDPLVSVSNYCVEYSLLISDRSMRGN